MLAELVGTAPGFPWAFDWDALCDWYWHGYVGRALVWHFSIGLVGQIAFFSRFAVQWIASEKSKKSVFPMAFWYLSLFGGVVVLTYGWLVFDPIIILGQTFGTLVYFRNITFRKRHAAADPDGAA